MLKNTLSTKTSLQIHHILTPQQLQYLKILQLPVTSLEQTIKHEIEENPFLEEDNDSNDNEIIDTQLDPYAPAPDQISTTTDDHTDPHNSTDNDYYNDTYQNTISLSTHASDDNNFDYYNEY